MIKRLKVFSFFSGSGFLDLGFENSRFDIEFVNEFSKSFMNAYKYSREAMGLRKPRFGYYNGDINELLNDPQDTISTYIRTLREEGNIVGFIGGPPCPDFSVAGKNKGKDGENGKLSKSYIDMIIKEHPDFFLFENVKGLWRTARHRAFFEELKNYLEEAGYALTNRLTNALEFGAPQDRDRILLFGISKELLGETSINSFPWTRFIRYDVAEIKKMPWPDMDQFSEDSVKACPAGINRELTVEYWFDRNGVTEHPNSGDYFIPRNGITRMKVIPEGDVSRKSYKRLHRWRYSPTVAYGNNEVHLHPYKERRLSAAEALALQTLPREFVLPLGMTLTDEFKTIGNGVPYVLAKGIADTIASFMEELK